jgi:hypothetical protein
MKSEDTAARLAGASLAMVAVLASGALVVFTAWSCLHNSGALAVACGNAKGRSLWLQALPAVTGIVGGAAAQVVGRRFRVACPLVASAGLVLVVTALLLIYFFGHLPPGHGPGFGD